MLNIGRALNLLAVKTGDEPLKAETHLSRTGLCQQRESSTIQRCIRICEIAREYTEALATNDVTAEVIEELGSVIEEVKTAVAEQVKSTAEKRLHVCG
ncbi:MAG: hypothetical protein JW863_03435 [Chitinispirillaceae bacterium]|nr:hypothetical protein [Chitinispirillaceae bacterium]